MAATALLTTLLLFLTVWRGGAICTSISYSAYPGMSHYEAVIYRGTVMYPGVTSCQSQCDRVNNCYGYVYDASKPDGSRCSHIFVYIERSRVYATGGTSIILYWRDCPSTTIPPRTTTTTRRPPPTRTPPPATPCPPADGLSTGMVVLIGVFTAIGGIILGMLLAAKCCNIGNGGSMFGGGKHPPHCLCPECKPVHGGHSCKDPGCTSCHKPAVPHSCGTPGCTSCHQVAPPSCTTCYMPGCTGCHPPQHPHMLHQKPVPAFPALHHGPGGVTPGQTFSVAASPYNDVYTVSLNGN